MSAPDSEEAPLPAALWETLRRDGPEPRAVHAAYLRFTARRPASPFGPQLLRWLGVGFLVGWGVAFAATGDPLFGAGRRFANQGVRPPPVASARARPRASVEVAPPPAAAARSSVSSESESASAPPAAAAPLAYPRTAASPPLSTAELGAGTALDPQWQRAATALKTHDYAAAEGALREIETAGSTGDRQAASLSLAQVLMTRGRMTEARGRLERLSTGAASPLVREKAKALLTEVFSTGDRSSGAPGATQ